MVYIKPWDKESERILRNLTRNKKAVTTNIKFTRDFGRRYPDIFDKKLIERWRNNEKRKTCYLLGDDVVIVPKQKKFFFHRI